MHVNKPTASKKPLIIVEGNIGAGKTTFLRLIGNALDAQLVYEPVEKWQNVSGINLLDHFYKDTQRWAYTFQTYAFITRVNEQKEAAKHNNKSFQILERSAYSDRYCFAKNAYEMGSMNELEWKLYCEWFSWLVEQYTPLPDAFIYLKTDPNTCFERLKKRNRSEEIGVEREYLNLLHTRHEEWLINKKDIAPRLTKVPVFTFECDQDFEHTPKRQEQFIDQLVTFLFDQFQLPAAQIMIPPAKEYGARTHPNQ